MAKKKKGGRGAQKRVVKVRMTGGICYEGQVDRNRKPNGEGVLTMPEGFRFEGTFVAGKLGGHAVMTSRDGNRYDGQYVAGKREGHGVSVYASGERYEGQFVADKREGHGVYVWPDGTRYDGQFVAHKMEGHGVEVFADGACYDGQYVADKREGHGVFVYPDGGRYEGQFVDGEGEGHGTFTFADDNASWEGTWSGSSAVGTGTWHFDCDGPAGGGTGQLYFSGDGPTGAEMDTSAAPTKWAQVAEEKAATAQQKALVEGKPSVTDIDGAADDDNGVNGAGNEDDDNEDGDGGTASSIGALPVPQCEPPIAVPQPTHDTAIEGGRAHGCHQCSARKTRAGAKLKLKWCSACMCARYCSEECQAADWQEHKGACRAHCAVQQQ
jgi:hypothetical protein